MLTVARLGGCDSCQVQVHLVQWLERQLRKCKLL